MKNDLKQNLLTALAFIIVIGIILIMTMNNTQQKTEIKEQNITESSEKNLSNSSEKTNISSPTLTPNQETSDLDLTGTPWEGMLLPKGTMLSITHGGSDQPLHTLTFTGGVTISETENGKVVAVDKSEHGAMLCTWKVITAIKHVLALCPSEETTELQQFYDQALEKTNQFIVDNDLMGMTKELLHHEEEIKFLQKKRDFSGKNLSEECRNGSLASMLKGIKTTSTQEFDTILNQSLAVPRPPVLEPCFTSKQPQNLPLPTNLIHDIIKQ